MNIPLEITKNLRMTSSRKKKPPVNLHQDDDKINGDQERCPSCASNRNQSPINIQKSAVSRDHHLKASQLRLKYESGDCDSLEVTKQGFIANASANTRSALTAPHLTGLYRLRQFHAHWGSDTQTGGSEHQLDGRSFAGEVHCVFWNTKYRSFEKACSNCDGVAVLAVFIKETENESNAALDLVLEAVSTAAKTHRPAHLSRRFNLCGLLPERLSYYTYRGSLTTPPYAECVIWTILRRPIKCSQKQLDQLRELVPANFRSVQEVNDREIHCSFVLIPSTSSSSTFTNRPKSPPTIYLVPEKTEDKLEND